jgi:Domain of unknown function (DUF4139)
MGAACRLTLVVLLALWGVVPAGANDLVLKRVLLSTGGVGYFEHEAAVEGPARLTLNVRRDQVDDVLKSIIVFDSLGQVGEIALPGEEPLRDAFRELPFERAALDSPASLLNALKGAEVRIAQPRQLLGRILAVVPEGILGPSGQNPVTRHRLSVMTGEGLRSLLLEEADGLMFADPGLQRQVERALTALATHGQKERRGLTVISTGAEKRLVRVGYVVEAPLWKTAYRLALPAGEGRAALQGWAVLENRSGEDWREVELTLVSGNPVTFRQALYAAYYVNRPEVPVEVFGRVLPRPDPGGIPAAPPRLQAKAMQELAVGQLAQPQAARMAQGAASSRFPVAEAELIAAEASEASTQVSFQVPRPITVASGDSLLVPIVAREAPVERVLLYQPATNPRHPLAAVRLTNDSDIGLPPGVLTLYERSASGLAFVGDARLGPLPVKERRLLSFAVDQKIRIDSSSQSSTAIRQGRIKDGILEISTREQQQTIYTIAAPADAKRLLLIDHPRPAGDWALVEPGADKAELVPGAWRLGFELAGEQRITVTTARPILQRLALNSLNPQQIAYYASAQAFDAKQRQAIAKLGELAGQVAERERQLVAMEKERAAIAQDQERLRDNLKAVPKESDLSKRYLGQLAKQEDHIHKLDGDAVATRARLETARAELAAYVGGLDL